MYTLFISTYSALVTIGLLKDGKEIVKKEKESLKSHSVILVPTIEEILKENKLDTKDLNEIIVVNGPGSFTGVRLGITVAKTLAYTLNIPIKTITSLEAIAIGIEEPNKIVFTNDNKGKYIGKFSNNKLDELIYLKTDDAEEYFNKYGYKVFEDNNSLDLNVIYEYLKDVEPTISHAVKAVYIKGIEALNGK